MMKRFRRKKDKPEADPIQPVIRIKVAQVVGKRVTLEMRFRGETQMIYCSVYLLEVV
ncbi:MAG: hypothetical protein ACYS6W_14425 [Planctomycetota bacterium]|jgi:hypothetical protein